MDQSYKKIVTFALIIVQIVVIVIFADTYINFQKFKADMRPRRRPGIEIDAEKAGAVKDQENKVDIQEKFVKIDLTIKEDVAVDTEGKPGSVPNEIEKHSSIASDGAVAANKVRVTANRTKEEKNSKVGTTTIPAKEKKASNVEVTTTSNVAVTPASTEKSKSLHSELDVFLKIKNNSVYRHFRIENKGAKEKTNLLMIVSSAPKRYDRRQAIRNTWWTLCKSTEKVKIKCIFMTDKQGKGSEYAQKISEENKKYKDIEFQDLGGGVEFGKRFLYHMIWAVRNYEFDYFMRLDDDYFLCLDKLINELPMPPRSMFHWGWVHCEEEVTRPEESIIIFSKDVIEMFLLQNPEKMRCHPWADQQIGLWVEDLAIRRKLPYLTDARLHHHPPARDSPEILAEKNICQHFLGIHGSYPKETQTLWEHRGSYDLSNETLLQHSAICDPNFGFDWSLFMEKWRYEPKLCNIDPKWDTTKQNMGGSYGGRQEA